MRYTIVSILPLVEFIHPMTELSFGRELSERARLLSRHSCVSIPIAIVVSGSHKPRNALQSAPARFWISTILPSSLYSKLREGGSISSNLIGSKFLARFSRFPLSLSLFLIVKIEKIGNLGFALESYIS